MTEQGDSRIDLNTAGVKTLRGLKGVGPSLAARIVSHRRRHGRFADVSDLQQVPGISAKTVAGLRDSVTVGPETKPPAAEWGLAPSPGRNGKGPKEPVSFFGYPDLLQGSVRLTNQGARKLRVAALRVEGCELWLAPGVRLTQIVTRPRLRAGETRTVPVSLAVDPATPPGSYEGAIVIGDERHAAVFNVAEKTSVTVTPSRIVLESKPGASFDKTLFVTNHGNMPLSLGDVGVVVLEDEDLSCRVIRGSAGELETPDLDTAVGVVVDHLRKTYQETEPLKVRTTSKPVALPPATTVEVGIRIRIPESLPKGRDCRASFRVFDASVTVLLRSQFS